MKIFCKVTASNRSLGKLTKGNIQLIGKNDFSLTKTKLVYYLTRTTLESNRMAENICMFFSEQDNSVLGFRKPKRNNFREQF